MKPILLIKLGRNGIVLRNDQEYKSYTALKKAIEEEYKDFTIILIHNPDISTTVELLSVQHIQAPLQLDKP